MYCVDCLIQSKSIVTRLQLCRQEVQTFNADILALQEVDAIWYKEFGDDLWELFRKKSCGHF